MKEKDLYLCTKCPGYNKICNNCPISTYRNNIRIGDILYSKEHGEGFVKDTSLNSFYNTLYECTFGKYTKILDYTQTSEIFIRTSEERSSFSLSKDSIYSMKEFCNGYCIYDCEGCKIKEILKKNG